MTTLVQFAAFAVLAAMAAYIFLLLFNGVRANQLSTGIADSERHLLQSRVAEIMGKWDFEREKNEFSWSGFRKFELARKVQEGGGICSFYLRPHDNKTLPAFDPGQYLTFRLDIAGQPKQVMRCYSLSDSPKPDYYRVSIKAVPPPRDKPEVPAGLASNFFHDQLKEGDILDVKAPGGHFFLDTTKHTPVVLIGGGIGLTPVLSMANRIVDIGSTRETHLFYGVRNGKEHVMKEHLERLATENENVHLHVCYSSPGDDDVEGRDYHHAERVGADLFKRVLPSNNYEYYFCGPPPMMNSLFEGLREWGVPEKDINYEAFGPATVQKKKEADTATDKAPAAASGDAAFDIAFEKSGTTAAWDPSVGSLLDLAEENGVDIDFGCRAGSCGTCIVAIKSGEVDYLSEPGEKPEAGSCLACVCVPKGPLALDA
jgi:ferredoxin-NADP reductase